MKTKIILSICLLIITCFITGCLKVIDFKRDEGVKLLVIDGGITAGEGPYRLKLSRTSPFGTGNPIYVQGAQITLFDDRGNSESYHEINEMGEYEVAGEIVKGIPGQSYHIEIELKNGQKFRSRPEQMPQKIEVSDIWFEETVLQSYTNVGILVKNFGINVFINTRFPVSETGPYLRWTTDEVWTFTEINPPGGLVLNKTCYMTEYSNTQNIFLYNGDGLLSDGVYEQLVLFRNFSYSFYYKHYYNVYQHSLSRSALDYWENIDQTVNQVGSIFDSPPAAVRGNVYNIDDEQELVLGYFQAEAVDTARIPSWRGDFENLRVPDLCEYNPYVPNPRRRACFNCLLLENSTTVRPPYF